MASSSRPIRVLFVCLGNICRSPQAEGAFARMVQLAGLTDRIACDSAGTGDWHAGEQPDRRTRATSARRGLPLQHAAQQVQPQHLDEFDLLIAMDASNLRHLQQMAKPDQQGKLWLLRAFEPSDGSAPGSGSGCGSREARLTRSLTPAASRLAFGSGSGSSIRSIPDVPDPYYGGPDGFDQVFEICWRSSFGLLQHLCADNDWPPPPTWLAMPPA